jgi:hypothetical protein
MADDFRREAETFVIGAMLFVFMKLFSHSVQLYCQVDNTVVEEYDKRAGMEADLKGDEHGLGLAVIRKRRLVAQTIVVLLTG